MKQVESEPKGCITKVKDYVFDEANTVKLKLAVFSFYGGAACLFPYFVLLMRTLGLSIREIALIYLITPIASILGPILSGIVADRVGRYSLVLAVNMIISTVFFLALLAVPPATQATVEISCTENSDYFVNFTTCNDCLKSADELKFQLEKCKYSDNSPGCLLSDGETECSDKTNFTATNPTGTCGMTVIHGLNNTQLSSCSLNSTLTCNMKSLSNCSAELSTEYSMTFYVFLAVKFLGSLFSAASFTMVDASLLAVTKLHGLDFGRQKIPGTIAVGVFPLIAGYLTDVHSAAVGYLTYTAAFLLATFCFAVAVVIVISMDIKIEPEKDDMLKNLGKLLTYPEVVLFFIVLTILGANFGFVETYIFIYLQSLGATGALLGTTLLVGCFASVPVLFVANVVEKKIGRDSIFFICFSMYAIRMIGYSYIHNPWNALYFELLEAFTYQFMWVTCLKMCPILAPKGLLATMTGCSGALHYSLGRGIGGFVGGHVIAVVGMRPAWRIFAGIALFGGVFYMFIHHCYLKKILIKRENEILLEAKKDIKSKEALLTGKSQDAHVLPEKEIQYTSMVTLTAEAQAPIGFAVPNISMEEESALRRRSVYNSLDDTRDLYGDIESGVESRSVRSFNDTEN